MPIQLETHSTLNSPSAREHQGTPGNKDWGTKQHSDKHNREAWDNTCSRVKGETQREPIRSNKERKWTQHARDRRVKQEVDTETHWTWTTETCTQEEEPEYKEDQINAKENYHSCPHTNTTKHCYTQEMTRCKKLLCVFEHSLHPMSKL